MRRILIAAAVALAPASCGPTATTKPTADAVPAPVAFTAGAADTPVHNPAPASAAPNGSEKRATHDPAPAAPAKAESAPPPLPHADRKDDPTVLIPGDPALTQGAMDRDIDLWEWILDLQFTDLQRARCQQLWMDDWKKKDDKTRARWLSLVQRNVEFWSGMADLSEGQRDLQRFQLQAPDLAALRKSSEGVDRWLVGLYDEAHQPCGGRNAVLVAGDPPLTQDMMDLYRTAMDYVLDLRMTAAQREEYQRVFIEDWKKIDPQQWAKNIESWRKPLSLSPYFRRVWRAQERPAVLDRLRKTKYDDERWLLAAYEAQQGDHKPGGERNPILADGDPPLTRDGADQYCDMVEGVLDFSISGGLTAGQRQDLQAILVKAWKAMDRASREDLLQSLQKWPSQERLLVQLRAAPAGDQLSQYLLEIRNREQEKFAAAMKQEELRHEGVVETVRAMPSGWHWYYDPRTGERVYVP